MACGKDEFVPTSTGTEFYPVQVGYSWIYNVEETLYTEVAVPEVRQYRLKVEIVDSMVNTAGTYTYVVYRSTQGLQDTKWTALDTWSIRPSDSEVVLYEGNTGFRKLIFPIRNNLTWNGNKYNALGEDNYVMSLTGQIMLAGTSFDETLTVEEENNDDFVVFLDEREDVYAKNVGLIKRSIRQLNYCTLENCIGQQKIRSGKIYMQELISYAKN